MAIIQVERLFTEIPDDYPEKGLKRSMTFEVKYENSVGAPVPGSVAKFCLEPMPGCCGIVVSTHTFVEESYRGGIIADWLHELKAKTAKSFGYTTMLMTTQLRNIPQVVGASKARWKFFHFFRNDRTGNDIGIAVKDL
jgi:hypothetical protein